MPRQRSLKFAEAKKAVHVGLRLPASMFESMETIRRETGWSQSTIIALHWRVARVLVEGDDHGKPQPAADLEAALVAAKEAHRLRTENEKKIADAERFALMKLTRVQNR